jgi:hypothetical protein
LVVEEQEFILTFQVEVVVLAAGQVVKSLVDILVEQELQDKDLMVAQVLD